MIHMGIVTADRCKRVFLCFLRVLGWVEDDIRPATVFAILVTPSIRLYVQIIPQHFRVCFDKFDFWLSFFIFPDVTHECCTLEDLGCGRSLWTDGMQPVCEYNSRHKLVTDDYLFSSAS